VIAAAPGTSHRFFQAMAIFLVSLWSVGEAADNSKQLAYRGVKAYREGHYAMAEAFFEKAVADARVKGERDFASMATANLVDVRLELGRNQEALTALQVLGPVSGRMRALVHWKKAQVELSLGRGDLAKAALDTVLASEFDPSWKNALELDRLRCDWVLGDTAGLAGILRSRLPEAGKPLRAGYLVLLGDVEFERSEWEKADARYEESIGLYRQASRYARAACLLWRRAECANALGHRERALYLLKDALAIASEVGMDPKGMERVLLGMAGMVDTLSIAKRRAGSDFEKSPLARPPADPGLLETENETESNVGFPPYNSLESNSRSP